MTTFVSPQMIRTLLDDELPDFLFQYVNSLVTEHGCDGLDGPPESEVLAKLPRPIRAGYTLVILESEVLNGGFYQWLTNSSCDITTETLDDARLIGADAYHTLIESALTLMQQLKSRHPQVTDDGPEVASEVLEAYWSDLETNFQPQFDALDSSFYALEKTAYLWNDFVPYVRQHADECVHS